MGFRGQFARQQSRPAHVRFSNRPDEVKRFQAIHHNSVEVAREHTLLFGIGTRPFHHGIRGRGGTIFGAALPSAGPSGHANSPHPSSREGHHSTAWEVFPAWALLEPTLDRSV